MSRRSRVVWDEDFVRYDFGDGHPMAPLRIDLTARLCRDLGLFAHVDVVDAGVADDDLLRTVHTAGLVDAVRRASADPRADVGHGVGTDDTPAFAGMHDSAARVFQGSVDLARAIAAGELEHGVNFAGGLHHATADAASGFCVYNDCAGAIRALLDGGVERVVYVDTDVHHGDGTEQLFWDDPRVTTISVHESGRTLFPGTGYPTDVGGDGAAGHRGQRRPARGHRGRGLAARHPRRRRPGRARGPPAGARHPARLRHPRPGPARAPAGLRGRPARGRGDDPRPRARALRRALAGARRGRLRAGRRGAAGLGAPGRRSPRTPRSTRPPRSRSPGWTT